MTLAAILGSVLASCLSWAAETESATEQFQRFTERERTRLAKIKSYTMKGEIKVIVEREFQKMTGGPLVMQRTFSLSGKDGRVKESVTALDERGPGPGTVVSYLDAKKVALIQGGRAVPRRLAKIFTLGPHEGLFNECPAFMEYSFLWITIPPGGIPALIPSDLSSSEKWATVAKSLQKAELGADGSLHVTLEGAIGSSEIDLVKAAGSGNDYKIRTIRFFNNDGYLARKIEVLEYFNDENVGRCGVSFRVSVYRSSASETLLATWELKIDDFAVNAPVDDEELIFDPATVDTIYDGDTEKWISVPK